MCARCLAKAVSCGPKCIRCAASVTFCVANWPNRSFFTYNIIDIAEIYARIGGGYKPCRMLLHCDPLLEISHMGILEESANAPQMYRMTAIRSIWVQLMPKRELVA